MIHRIMLAAALLSVPAIVVAEPVQVPTAGAQHTDSAKAKNKQSNKKSHGTSGKKAAPKAAPHDSGK